MNTLYNEMGDSTLIVPAKLPDNLPFTRLALSSITFVQAFMFLVLQS